MPKPREPPKVFFEANERKWWQRFWPFERRKKEFHTGEAFGEKTLLEIGEKTAELLRASYGDKAAIGEKEIKRLLRGLVTEINKHRSAIIQNRQHQSINSAADVALRFLRDERIEISKDAARLLVALYKAAEPNITQRWPEIIAKEKRPEIRAIIKNA